MRFAPYVQPARVNVRRRDDGALILTNPHPMRPAFANVAEPLAHWALSAPDRVWLAACEDGDWRSLTYAQGWSAVRRLAAGLVQRFAPGSVIAVGSGNSLRHGVLTYACALAGLVVAPIVPAYSLRAADPGRLHQALRIAGAAAVFIEGSDFARAVGWVAEAGLEVIDADGLDRMAEGTGVAPEAGDIDPGAVCKLLLTSGSTGAPKAVMVTNANLAMNAAQIRATFDAAAEAAVWPDGIAMANHLPWSHSLGGNAVLHMLTHAGGSLWIDPGAPTAGGVSLSAETIKRVRPSYHITVPVGWSLLVRAMEEDEALARALFERLRIAQYGGAALTQDVHARLQALARRTIGEEVTLAAGYGATETGPTVCNVHWPNDIMGLVGLPVPGLELKLVPQGGKLEARVRGPGITPGYHRDPERTAAAFDEEGFYCLGDALRFVDPDRPEAGLAFDGRLAEEFKLSNGTFVPAGAVRAGLVQAADGLFADAVICGEGREEIGALVFLDAAGARAISGLPDAALADLAGSPAVRDAAAHALARASAGQPVSRRVARIMLLRGAPSFEDGEITDKGSLNQGRCRERRAASLAALWEGGDGVIAL